MKIHILTLFPEMFTAVTHSSILGRARDKGLLEVTLTDIRDYSQDKHQKTDEYPYGGGAGMVLMADPVFRAMEAVKARGKKAVYMSPRGQVINQQTIEALSVETDLVLLCGHYEGVDQRILDYWDMEELSVGDYVLTGGELPAMVLVDAVARLIPGVLGSSRSVVDESISSGLLEHPQYTKPREYAGMKVPDVLVGGNHLQIRLWKLEESLRLTKERRPDLLEQFLNSGRQCSKEEEAILRKVLETD